MACFYDFTNNYDYDPIRYLGLEEFFDEGSEIDLYVGVNFAALNRPFKRNTSKITVYLDYEYPNKLLSELAVSLMETSERRFDKIFTICPYTCEWRNKQLGVQKYHLLPCVMSLQNVPPKTRKTHDICYTGHYHSYQRLRKIICSIRGFSHRIVSNSNDSMITDRRLSFAQKIGVVASSKISLVHNLLFVDDPVYLDNVTKLPGYERHSALKDIGTSHLSCQIKYRTFEAAFSRSVMLCIRDPWNVVEKFFKEGEHFVYCEENNIAAMVAEILKDYPQYERMAERSYQHAMSHYTSEALAKLIREKVCE